nr:phosphate transport system regulator PhoU [Candidatus Contendobacter sp.]
MAISHDAHTVKQFDVLLANLRNLVLEMGGLVEDQIQNAIKALDNEDITAAREVIARDQIINGMQVKVDEDCVNLIALRQPLGSDLRLIISLSKIVTDLERIGDEAEKIARMTVKTYDGVSSSPSAKL